MQKLIRSHGLTTDVIIFTIEEGLLKVLLIKRANEPFKDSWALPGGFIWDNEGSQDAASRILKEKAGLGVVSWRRVSSPRNSVVKNVYLEQLYTFDSSGRDPRGRVCTIAYFALVLREEISFESVKNIQTPVLYPVNKLPQLAFDHKRIVDYAIKRLQAKLEYTNAVYALLPSAFTFSQLQTAYETILAKKLDKRNFSKKFSMLKLIKPTKNVLTGNRQRPARLYQFISRKPIELKKFF